MSAKVEVVSKAKVNLKVTTVAGSGGGGGVSDHGQLTGLLDDDHPQYQRSEATYTSTSPFTITDESVVITTGSAVTLPDAATMASRLVGVGAAASTVTISPAGTDTMFDDPGNTYSLPAGNGITFVSVQISGAWGWAIYTRNGPAFDMPKWFGQSLADGSVLKIASGVPAWGAAPTPTAHASSHSSAGSDPVTLAQSQVTNLTTDLAGKVPTTRNVSAGTGLTGGGDLSADRTLAVSYGTTSGTAAQGNDSRITGALQASNNLSDVTTLTTGRSNLGVPVDGSSFVAASIASQVAETFNPTMLAAASVASSLTSGRLHLVGIWLPKGLTLANIAFCSGSTALATGTNQWFVLANSSRQALRFTTNDTSTAWAANSVKSLPLTSSFTTTYSGLHYVGVMVAATTVPTLRGLTSTVNSTGLTIESFTSDTGQTTPPAEGTTFTLGTRGSLGFFWAGLS